MLLVYVTNFGCSAQSRMYKQLRGFVPNQFTQSYCLQLGDHDFRYAFDKSRFFSATTVDSGLKKIIQFDRDRNVHWSLIVVIPNCFIPLPLKKFLSDPNSGQCKLKMISGTRVQLCSPMNDHFRIMCSLPHKKVTIYFDEMPENLDFYEKWYKYLLRSANVQFDTYARFETIADFLKDSEVGILVKKDEMPSWAKCNTFVRWIQNNCVSGKRRIFVAKTEKTTHVFFKRMCNGPKIPMSMCALIKYALTQGPKKSFMCDVLSVTANLFGSMYVKSVTEKKYFRGWDQPITDKNRTFSLINEFNGANIGKWFSKHPPINLTLNRFNSAAELFPTVMWLSDFVPKKGTIVVHKERFVDDLIVLEKAAKIADRTITFVKGVEGTELWPDYLFYFFCSGREPGELLKAEWNVQDGKLWKEKDGKREVMVVKGIKETVKQFREKCLRKRVVFDRSREWQNTRWALAALDSAAEIEFMDRKNPEWVKGNKIDHYAFAKLFKKKKGQ